MAVFFHEVPHNVADFAILISNGFSRVGALQAQWASAMGALLGTLAGLRLHSIQGMQVFVCVSEVRFCVRECVSA
jgi:solute carrier family 39 (zinc transporter), member 7